MRRNTDELNDETHADAGSVVSGPRFLPGQSSLGEQRLEKTASIAHPAALAAGINISFEQLQKAVQTMLEQISLK